MLEDMAHRLSNITDYMKIFGGASTLGLGKKRSRLGRFIDENGVSQEDLRKVSGLNKESLSRICNEDDVNMRSITRKALVDAVRELTGKDVKADDFWKV